MKKLPNREGVIALITLLILLGVGALGIAMVITSQLNTTAANNYRYKLQTYSAADGIITLLSQDVLDFNEAKYLTSTLSNCKIGTTSPTDPSTSGYYSHSFANGTDTIKSDGSDIWSSTDHFHFAYVQMSGDIQYYVKVESMTNTDGWAKAGLMIRQSLANNSAYVLWFVSPSNGINLQDRISAGANATAPYQKTGVSCPYWLRLTKTGNNFVADYSTTGATWTTASTVTISMTDPVYVGITVCSHNLGNVCTGIFSNLTGLPLMTGSGTAKVGDNLIPVNYSITQTGTNTFSMSAESFIESGPSKIHNYTTRLNQGLSREAAGAWHSSAKDSARIPVTLYDMRADLSNPEFDVNASYVNGGGYQPAHIIRTDTLTADRKVIKRKLTVPDTVFRYKMLSCWSYAWYAPFTSASDRQSFNTGWKIPCIGTAMGTSGTSATFPWSFCDSIHTWFRPWGGDTAGTTYDTVSGKWSGLKMRPGWTPHYANEDTEWVAQHWDSTYKFANIVMYDTLVFNEKYPPDTGVFRFGDTVYNPKWFFIYHPAGCGTSTDYRFMPLQMRGFGYDCRAIYSVDACDSVAWKKQNYSFTMEFHRSFTYKKSQTFSFTGDDDVWVFINNKCVIDLGGVHDHLSATVNLDTLGLTEGLEYPFDFFYCERYVAGSHILITTNLLFYIPPQPLKRSWKRDYGNLD